jgi:hypothetical protein
VAKAGGAGHDLVGINGGILSRRPLSLVLGVPRNVLLSSLPSTKRPLLRRFAVLEEAATTSADADNAEGEESANANDEAETVLRL